MKYRKCSICIEELMNIMRGRTRCFQAGYSLEMMGLEEEMMQILAEEFIIKRRKNMDKLVLIIGDSYASAYEGDTGIERGGWPVMMNIPVSHRHGISGSTADEWNSNVGGRLEAAKTTAANIVIISLMGNDARAAISDGQVTPDEISNALSDMRKVVKVMLRPLTIVLLYPDPFSGKNLQSRVAVPLLNGAIKSACAEIPVVFADTGLWLKPEHFGGIDIHPNIAGHKVIAEEMLKIINKG